jgi:hypothetical protein
MANFFVRSTDGSDSDNGTTWALARATLASASALESAGDVIYVSDAHAESTAGTQTIALAGTGTSPVRVLCGDDAAEPPTSLATTATVATTGTTNIVISGTCYVYGIAFTAGSGGGSTNIHFGGSSTAGDIQHYKNCDFILGGSGSSGRLELGSSGTGALAIRVLWENCDVKFAGTAQGIGEGGVDLIWQGGTILSGSAAVTSLFRAPVAASGGRASRVLVQGVDFTNLSTTTNIFDAASTLTNGVLRNCRLPASWAGALVTGTLRPSQRFEMYNTDNGDTNYKLRIMDYAGSMDHETTIVRTGGASDGTTALSWKMASTANCNYPCVPLASPEIVKWNDSTGSKTVTVEIVHDSQGAGTGSDFQNDEISLHVQYLGTSGVPLALFASSAKADVLASAADITNSSETWTTTGLTTPVKQVLSVTFTAEEKGFVIAKVLLHKASKTVYVDPEMTIS